MDCKGRVAHLAPEGTRRSTKKTTWTNCVICKRKVYSCCSDNLQRFKRNNLPNSWPGGRITDYEKAKKIPLR